MTAALGVALLSARDTDAGAGPSVDRLAGGTHAWIVAAMVSVGVGEEEPDAGSAALAPAPSSPSIAPAAAERLPLRARISSGSRGRGAVSRAPPTA